MAAIYSNGGNRWNILGFNFTKRDALSSVYKISMLLYLTFEQPAPDGYSGVAVTLIKSSSSNFNYKRFIFSQLLGLIVTALLIHLVEEY